MTRYILYPVFIWNDLLFKVLKCYDTKFSTWYDSICDKENILFRHVITMIKIIFVLNVWICIRIAWWIFMFVSRAQNLAVLLTFVVSKLSFWYYAMASSFTNTNKLTILVYAAFGSEGSKFNPGSNCLFCCHSCGSNCHIQSHDVYLHCLSPNFVGWDVKPRPRVNHINGVGIIN